MTMQAKNKYSVFAHYILALVFLLFLPVSAWAEQQSAPPERVGLGYIDAITFDGTQASAQGWAATESASQQITSISIFLEGKKVYEGPFERSQRPDVAKSFNRPQWQGSGWRVSFDLPEQVKAGVSNVTATARTRGGDLIALSVTPTAEKFSITPPSQERKKLIFRIKVVIACALVFLVICFLKASLLTGWINTRFKTTLSEPGLFSFWVLLVSFLFVGIGLTGSSLRLGQPNIPFMQMDITHLLASDQPVRSDEWLVMTPLAIAQYNHEPRFPVVNNTIGEDGQNMLIIGMTGAPVAHLSALAKPATWGYFFFDLRRALSWSWCFSIVGCFLALAFVFNSLSGGHWKYGFVFSGLFCCMPYVVAWSFWPAYTVFFPCLIFLCSLQILRASSFYTLLPLAVGLGLAGAGFILVLYPAWQVSVGYVFAALMIGMVIRDKLYKNITPRRTVAYVFALAITGIIISAWWIDARDAVAAMQNTVYPGQRFAVGGGNTVPQLLRGFSNLATLMQVNGPVSNQSEMASFYYLLLPLAALFILHAVRKTLTPVDWLLALITGFIVFYMFVGVPAGLAKYSLWSNVTSPRADLALGLCSLMLTCVLVIRKDNSAGTTNIMHIIALAISLAWSYVVYKSLNQLDRSLLTGLNASIIMALLVTTTAISYCLITQKIKPFIYLCLGLSFSTSVSFNPVNIAPKRIQLAADTGLTPINFIKGKKILVLDNTITAMYLAASGASVVNGIFYYPQPSLWKRLDPEARLTDVYNRYQHLIYLSTTPPAPPFSLGTPQADVVTVSVNLQTFDFRLTNADIILSADGHNAELTNNTQLAFIASANGWSWFEVKKN